MQHPACGSVAVAVDDGKKEQVNLRLRPALRARVKNAARAHGVSSTAVVERALERLLVDLELKRATIGLPADAQAA